MRNGGVNIGVEGHELQNRVENLGHSVTVEANKALSYARRGEVAVADNYLVAVSHLHEDLEKLGGDDR